LLKNPKVYNPAYTTPKKGFPKIYIYLLIIVIILAGLIYLVFYSSFFKIKNIIIENSNNSEVSQTLAKLNGINIFRFNIGRTQDEVSEIFPEVKGVKITRGLPNTLKIQFQERASAVAWQTQDKTFLIDSNGVIYKEISSTSEESNNLPVIKDNNNVAISEGQKILSQNFLNFITELSSKFNETTGYKITRFEVNETTFQVDVIIDQSWKLIFDTNRNVDDQLSDLTKFLADHKDEVEQYIDLRIEGRVYFK